MYRFYSFFVCLLVLAACSPKLYRGEHVARTSIQENIVDSTNVSGKQESVVSGTLESTVDASTWSNQVVVTEKYSAPDSAGRQYVTERTTRTSSRRAESSAKLSQMKEEKQVEQIDSVAYHTETAELQNEEESKGRCASCSGWPWYAFIVAMIFGAFLGIVIGVRGGRFFSFLSR